MYIRRWFGPLSRRGRAAAVVGALFACVICSSLGTGSQTADQGHPPAALSPAPDAALQAQVEAPPAHTAPVLPSPTSTHATTLSPTATATPPQSPSPAPATLTPIKSEGPRGLLAVHFIDVAQGDATLLQGPDFVILIDGGRHDRDDVVPYLRSADVTSIDLLIGTHPHADHIGQFPQVLSAFPVGEVWMSGEAHTTRTYERALDAILDAAAGYHEPRAGEAMQIGSARLEVVNPLTLTGDLHEGSISVRVVYGDIAFLFTGDAEGSTEGAMIARGHDLRAQVLQLGHHGSGTSSSTEFLQAVRPQVAIYSAGTGNSYRHPHAEVLERLSGLGVEVYGTDQSGTIRIATDGRFHEVQLGSLSGARAPSEVDATSTLAPTSSPPIQPAASGSGCAAGQVDINTAPKEELVRIKHIGDVRAEELIRLRPFRSPDDLIRISGIGPQRLADIKAEQLACVRT